MVNEEVVRFIVGTYDLPPELENRLVGIACRRLDELVITGFDNVYRYIDQLVEKFGVSYEEKTALRLDSRLNQNTETTFHNLFGVEQPDLDEPEEHPEGITIDDAISILGGQIGELELGLLRQLLPKEDNNGNTLTINPHEIIKNAEQIQRRLEELVHKYERDGRLVIPQRPIIYVQFNPLTIRYGYRRIRCGCRHFNGDPLAYFRKHEHDYKGMSRKELSLFDSYLYVALLKAKQINDAIPRGHPGRKELSPEEVRNILAAHTLCNGNPSKAARLLHYSPITICRYWEKEGMRAQRLRRKKYEYDGDPLAYFRTHEQDYGGMSRGRLSKFDPGQYRALLRAGQLKEAIPDDKRKEGRKKLSPEAVDMIVRTYHECSDNRAEVARRLPYSRSTVRKYLGLHGLIQ